MGAGGKPFTDGSYDTRIDTGYLGRNFDEIDWPEFNPG
jgi:hypothetical protein